MNKQKDIFVVLYTLRRKSQGECRVHSSTTLGMLVLDVCNEGSLQLRPDGIRRAAVNDSQGQVPQAEGIISTEALKQDKCKNVTD